MSKGRVTKTVFTVMLILLVLVVSPAETLSSSNTVSLTVLGGTTGGMWYVIAGGLSEIFKGVLPGSAISVEPGGGTSNVSLVNSGEAHLGLANACSLFDGWAGNEPFGTPHTEVRAIAGLFPQYLHIVALKESGIRKVEDLKSKRFTPSQPGQTSYIMAQHVLSACDISFDQIPKEGGRVLIVSGFGDALERMKDKQIDAIVWLASPQPGFVDLASVRPIEVVGISEEMIQKIISMYPMYSPMKIPAGLYKGQDDEVPSIGTMTVLIVNKDVPDDVVYEITKSIFENADRLLNIHPSALSYVSAERSPKDLMIPLHPGAERYYREVGAIK